MSSDSKSSELSGGCPLPARRTRARSLPHKHRQHLCRYTSQGCRDRSLCAEDLHRIADAECRQRDRRDSAPPDGSRESEAHAEERDCQIDFVHINLARHDRLLERECVRTLADRQSIQVPGVLGEVGVATPHWDRPSPWRLAMPAHPSEDRLKNAASPNLQQGSGISNAATTSVKLRLLRGSRTSISTATR